MNISTKVLLIIIATLGSMILSVYLFSYDLFKTSYLKLERQQVSELMMQAVEGTHEVGNSLNNMLLSYALWDDTSQFMLDKNQHYIDGNLLPSVLSVSGIDIVLYYDVLAKLFYAISLNSDRTGIEPLPVELLQAFEENGALRKIVQNPQSTNRWVGLYAIPKGILFLAAHSILSTNGEGPARGTVIMLKYFTQHQLKSIMEFTGLDLSITRITNINQDEQINEIYQQTLKEKKPYEKILNEEVVLGYTFLNDIDNNPIAVLKASIPRITYQIGMKAIQYFYLVFILISSLLILILFYLLWKIVLKRLKIINYALLSIKKKSDFSLRLPEEGPLELKALTNKINEILLNIEKIYLEMPMREEDLDRISKDINRLSNNLRIIKNILSISLDFIPAMLIVVDSQMNITNLNQMVEKEIKISKENAKGTSLFKLFPYLQSYKNDISEALNERISHKIEKIVVTTPQGVGYFSALLYPFEHSGLQFLILVIQDISDQVKFDERLVQNDKYASIGILTAGVAHEINNPINFVKSSVNSIKHDLVAIGDLLIKYSVLQPNSNFEEQIKNIEILKQTIDLDYLLNELETLVQAVKDGTNRTATILGNLKSFSRFDEKAMKHVDIHLGLDSTLMLLHHKYKDKIKINKQYGDIPKIACFPGKLNQVFMNILSNAIEATPEKGEITIRTASVDEKHIIISIKDSGIGISEKNLARIFDPFFSTKLVGQGTGLGLSISAGIIRDHKGLLEVKSEINKGAEFIITFPIDQ